MIRHLYTSAFLLLGFTGFAQQRYHHEVFQEVMITTDIQYAQNYTVLSGTPTLSDLYLDVYEPLGDTVGNPFYQNQRPVVIIAHGGAFLPTIYNGTPFGTKEDSAVVELCKRLSKRGYVAIAISYRLGWNPLSTDIDIRVGTLINAMYRGMQDMKSCVRYLRKGVDVDGNLYRIDTSKIVIGGFEGGGAMALVYSSLDNYAELTLAPFLDFSQIPPVPYIDTAIVGDWEGQGGSPSNNIYNHLGYSSKVDMVFNLSGWMIDTTWIDPGEVPIVGMQCLKDLMYTTVVFPSGPPCCFPIGLARGNHEIMKRVNGLGNNDVFANVLFTDLYSLRAVEINEGFSGLYPFVLPDPGSNTCIDGANTLTENEQISPWNWWDETTYISAANAVGKDGELENCKARLINPDMSPEKGRLCTDTIVGYLNPRMICALGLPDCGATFSGIEENRMEERLEIYPNPVSSSAIIYLQHLEIGSNSRLTLYDIAGREMVAYDLTMGQQELEINLESFDDGVYIVRLSSPDGNYGTGRFIICQ